MNPRLECWAIALFILACICVLASAADSQQNTARQPGASQQAGEGPAQTPKGGSWRPGSSPYAGTGEEKPATTTTGLMRERRAGGDASTQVSATPDATPSTREPTGKRPARGLATAPAHNGVAPEATPAADPIQPTAGVALLLARICRLEADWRLADCTAIYHIGRKRFGEFWLAGLLEYSKLYRRTQPRARRISQAPWGDIPGAGKRENERWKRLRLHALELVSGKHKDPCREAVHWGGRMDVPHPKQIPAKCAAQGRTANTLYRVK